MTDEFAATLAELRNGRGDSAALSAAFLVRFPVTGATVATVGGLMGSETLSATGELARRLDELQFDLGEGPCWDAISRVTPVLESRFLQNGPKRWPALASALEGHRIGSLFAFPMAVGPVRLGAVDLYSHESLHLDVTQQRRAAAMADAIGHRVLREALASGADLDAETPFTRRVIHQAAGFVLAQVDVSADDAMLLIQAHAFTAGKTMKEVAEGILDRELAFVRVGDRIEVQP